MQQEGRVLEGKGAGGQRAGARQKQPKAAKKQPKSNQKATKSSQKQPQTPQSEKAAKSSQFCILPWTKKTHHSEGIRDRRHREADDQGTINEWVRERGLNFDIKYSELIIEGQQMTL